MIPAIDNTGTTSQVVVFDPDKQNVTAATRQNDTPQFFIFLKTKK